MISFYLSNLDGRAFSVKWLKQIGFQNLPLRRVRKNKLYALRIGTRQKVNCFKYWLATYCYGGSNHKTIFFIHL